MSATLAERFSERATQAPDQAPLLRTGRLDQMVGLALQARGLSLPLESACAIETAPDCWVPAEVVGFADDRTFLMPAGLSCLNRASGRSRDSDHRRLFR